MLTDKQYRQYSYFSRYSSFPIYYDTNNKRYLYGVTSQLNKDTTYVIYKTKRNDTWDSIALFYYNSPEYYWVLCDFNNIQDPFADIEEGQEIKIPTLTAVTFEE